MQEQQEWWFDFQNDEDFCQQYWRYYGLTHLDHSQSETRDVADGINESKVTNSGLVKGKIYRDHGFSPMKYREFPMQPVRCLPTSTLLTPPRQRWWLVGNAIFDQTWLGNFLEMDDFFLEKKSTGDFRAIFDGWKPRQLHRIPVVRWCSHIHLQICGINRCKSYTSPSFRAIDTDDTSEKQGKSRENTDFLGVEISEAPTLSNLVTSASCLREATTSWKGPGSLREMGS